MQNFFSRDLKKKIDGDLGPNAGKVLEATYKINCCVPKQFPIQMPDGYTVSLWEWLRMERKEQIEINEYAEKQGFKFEKLSDLRKRL